jgi:hypothetical protein
LLDGSEDLVIRVEVQVGRQQPSIVSPLTNCAAYNALEERPMADTCANANSSQLLGRSSAVQSNA